MQVTAVGHRICCWVILMISFLLVLFLVSFYIFKERKNIKLGRQGGQDDVEVLGRGKNMIKGHSVKKFQ